MSPEIAWRWIGLALLVSMELPGAGKGGTGRDPRHRLPWRGGRDHVRVEDPKLLFAGTIGVLTWVGPPAGGSDVRLLPLRRPEEVRTGR
jgi:hypothetical protein